MRGLASVILLAVFSLPGLTQVQEVGWYSSGYAKLLSQQGKVVLIEQSVVEGATDSERQLCESETLTEGDVRRYLALADDSDVVGHDFSSYPCKFLVTIVMADERWLLDLNVSGLGYLRDSKQRWHTIGCGLACSAFMPNAGTDAELCLDADDAC